MMRSRQSRRTNVWASPRIVRVLRMLRNVICEMRVNTGGVGTAILHRISEDIIDVHVNVFNRVRSTNETRLIRNLQCVARRRNERVYCITFEGATVLYITP